MLLQLLLQLAVIIVTARAFGALFQQLRQPAVVGEMIAGILLGPSLLGYLLPDLYAALFPTTSRPALTLIAQIGVLTFMFVVGTGIELGVFRRHTRTIAAVSMAGIITPFVLGAALAVFLHEAYARAIPKVPFVFFMATATSVTAFPVLARIIVERRLSGTVAGDTALICASFDDVVAWVLVASVAGLVGGTENVSIKVHGVFAAFAAGVACAALVPRLTSAVASIEAPVSKLFLPVFFVLTGLRTDVRLIAAGSASWIWCLLIVATATVGKMGGTTLAALASGIARADALTIGALMNTRGLMELVVLNIGYELGLLPPEVFAMMVVMTLATTCAAGPLVDRWAPRSPEGLRYVRSAGL